MHQISQIHWCKQSPKRKLFVTAILQILSSFKLQHLWSVGAETAPRRRMNFFLPFLIQLFSLEGSFAFQSTSQLDGTKEKGPLAAKIVSRSGVLLFYWSHSDICLFEGFFNSHLIWTLSCILTLTWHENGNENKNETTFACENPMNFCPDLIL